MNPQAVRPGLTEPGSASCDEVLAAAGDARREGVLAPSQQLRGLRACIDREDDAGNRMRLTRAYVALLAAEDLPDEAHELLHHTNDFVRDEASSALVERGADALPALQRLTRDEDKRVRWFAYEAVARAAEPDLIDLLVQGLADDDFAVRWVASDGLITIGSASIVPTLRALVREHANPLLHSAARRVLSRVDTPEGWLRDELDRLVDSLDRETTIYQSEVIANEILQRLFGRGAQNA